MKDRNGYAVKGVKQMEGRDGYMLNCSLYKDGKKVATVIDDGNGGCLDIHFLDYKAPRVEVSGINYMDEPFNYKGTPEEKAFQDYVNTLPTYDTEWSKNQHPDQEHVINEMVDEYENLKRFKRACKKKTLFRLKGDEDSYYTIKYPYCEKVRKHLETKYGDKLDSIINEEVA